MVKLEIGDWGSNSETLGVSEYRGYHIVVDDGDMDMPVEGGSYRIGIYASQSETEYLVSEDGDDYSMEKIQRIVENLIDGLIHFKNKG